jgi:peptidoglycan/xylan/chitin deacetylase (PgdA/CDA1 family)
MYDLKYFIRELKTSYLQLRVSKRVPVRMDRAIISITFDDVPRSAMTNGVPILDSFNVKATFYIAMGLSTSNLEDTHNNKNKYGIFLTPTDILELSHCGHDIACHTYSHYMLDSGTADELELDAQRNVRELCALLDLSSIEHFAYPYGRVNFTLKKLLAKNYKTMRSTLPGINQKSTDMYLLRANGISNHTFNKVIIRQMIKDAEHTGGWLIFYAHGVKYQPDAHSCSSEQFEWLIRECKSSSAQILTISEAYSTIIKSRQE